MMAYRRRGADGMTVCVNRNASAGDPAVASAAGYVDIPPLPPPPPSTMLLLTLTALV